MNKDHLPRTIVAAICLLSVLPALLRLLGWPIDLTDVEMPPQLIDLKHRYPTLPAYYQLAGPFLHTVLEWTACCVAIVTGLFSFVHYRLKHDVTTPIIGTALFFSGMLDAFNILAADRLTFPVTDLERFIPFTWAVSRTFNIAILFAGTLPFLLRKSPAPQQRSLQETRYLLLVGLLFGLMAYAIIQIFAVVIEIPASLFPQSRLPRPWDLLPLIFWLLTGLFVFPRFWKRHPSLFSHSLMISVFPAVISQTHMAFQSSALFDHDFFSAYFLKILVYCTPLIGLILDYSHAHQAEIAFRETETKLEAARQITLSLLPAGHPQVSGLDIAGFSYASEAVGGDYYDFLDLSEDRLGVVVGDVSGHDLAAAILASQTRAYLRAYANSLPDLGQVMTRLNEALVIDTQQRRFVTMFCAVFDASRRSLVYSAAGHQGYLLRHDGSVETLDSQFLPLGMTDQDMHQIGQISDLLPGDRLLIVTDGLTEALSPAEEQYGLPRVLEFLQKNVQLSSHDLLQALKLDVNQFCHFGPPSDDVTVVLACCQPDQV